VIESHFPEVNFNKISLKARIKSHWRWQI